jgi:hypothetical protein
MLPSYLLLSGIAKVWDIMLGYEGWAHNGCLTTQPPCFALRWVSNFSTVSQGRRQLCPQQDASYIAANIVFCVFAFSGRICNPCRDHWRTSCRQMRHRTSYYQSKPPPFVTETSFWQLHALRIKRIYIWLSLTGRNELSTINIASIPLQHNIKNKGAIIYRAAELLVEDLKIPILLWQYRR